MTDKMAFQAAILNFLSKYWLASHFKGNSATRFLWNILSNDVPHRVWCHLKT